MMMATATCQCHGAARAYSAGLGVQYRRISTTRIKSSMNDEDKLKAMQEAVQNPELLKAVEERMKQPEVQDEMKAMNAMMSNPEFMARAASLREDPELAPMFEEIKTGGMAAMMKYMNDPTFLSKVGEKLGDIPAPQGVASPEPPSKEADINTILDAARYGDLEAIEDFVAIGKGEVQDDQGRTALHYAVAYDQGAAAGALIENGVDIHATDAMGNTALHFAAGYGRGNAVKALLSVGVDPSVKNKDGKTAKDLILEQPKNPLHNVTEILEDLS